MSWTLKGRVIGAPQDAGIKFGQTPNNAHCLNCGDAVSDKDLVRGLCFDPCRYGRYLRKEGRLEIRASYQGAEALDFKPKGAL